MGSVKGRLFDRSLLKTVADQMLKSSVSATGLPFSIAIVTDAEEDIYANGFGELVWGSGESVDPDSVVLLASATKPITATAALQLIEKGVLELDVPASTYVSEMDKLMVLEGWGDNGTPRLRPPKTAITLRHLLTHTSGLSYEIWNADILRYLDYAGIPGLETLDYRCLFTPLVADPGSRWEYGISMDWVGQIIEAVSGQGLQEYFQQHIFEPLGMKDTSLKLSDDMAARLGRIHYRNDQGELEATDFIAEQNGEFEEAGGGLYSTCRDYTRFIRMVLNDGEGESGRVLSSASVKLLHDKATGELDVTKLKTVMPEVSNDAEFFPGLRKNWSLGFMRNEEKCPTGRSAGSLAWAGLFNFYFWIDPELQLGGVFTTQLQPFADQQALQTFSGFEQAVYDCLER